MSEKQSETIIFYDTETTGFVNGKVPDNDRKQPHIVQIGAVLCNRETREIIKEMDVTIKPDGWTIPDVVAQIHGITTEIARDRGIDEGEAIEQFLELCEGAERVAFNSKFDQRIVSIGLARFFEDSDKVAWDASEGVCAMALSKDVCRIPLKSGKGYKNPKLSEAYKHFAGYDLEDAHTALADARACMLVYFGAIDAIARRG